ncbi:MAG: UDP-N-acetylmuramoyl-tripeptide--D-alanyl-D-alanine ligase [Acidobacteria bacterium]|nr:UDP-N-acetylmuramoyl-tripeptide--D-alanyl-D-alanine ligase [Acidobacteriota bacterium]
MKFSLQQIADILGVGRDADSQVVAGGWSIDTRTIQPGDVFFALAGPRHDGHDYVAAAFAAGAVAAVVGRSWDTPDAGRAGFLYRVDDPLRALTQLAYEGRRRWDGTVVALTGSNGKTTTKEIVAALLATKMRVSKTVGNLNNEIGVPLTILRIDDDADAAVLELGMNHAGEIERLARLARPDVGLVTNVSAAHVGHFHSVEGVAAAKRELIDELSDDAVAVLNADDARVREFGEGRQGRTVTFGMAEPADYRAVDVELGPDGARFGFKRKDRKGQPLTFESHLPGRHNVLNMTAGLAVAVELGLEARWLRKAAAAIRPASMRGEIRPVGDWLVVDDCYNSNPAAAEAMLDVLAELPGKRKVAVLGEMLELGDSAAALHRQVGRKAAGAADLIVAVRGAAREIAEGAAESGAADGAVKFFEDADQAGAALRGLLQPGDTILFKGSRGVGLERALAAASAGGGR